MDDFVDALNVLRRWFGRSRAWLSGPPEAERREVAICVDNRGYEASLVRYRPYLLVRDTVGEADGLVRIIDESGEDYLYEASRFVIGGDMTRSIALDEIIGPVPYRFKVYGHVREDEDDSPVQVLVLAQDGRWYLQADSHIDPNHPERGRFEVEVCAGYPESYGVEYSIIAVTGTRLRDETYPGPAIPTFPTGTVVSNAIVVRRREQPA